MAGAPQRSANSGGTTVKELVYHRQLLPAVEHHAGKVGFKEAGAERTYAEHLDRTLRLGHALEHQLGLARSDRFAVMALNSLAYLEMYHAAFLGQGVIHPLTLRLAPRELAYILADSGTKVCFVDGFFAELIDKVRGETAIEQVV